MANAFIPVVINYRVNDYDIEMITIRVCLIIYGIWIPLDDFLCCKY